jgi:hypothetical protein
MNKIINKIEVPAGFLLTEASLIKQEEVVSE